MNEYIDKTNYQISSFGEIINTKTGNEIKQFKDRFGYMKVNLYIDGKYRQFYVHRLVAEAFLEKPAGVDSKSLCVKHKDFNKANNYVGNLEWETFSRIIKDAYEKDIYKAHLQTLKKKIAMIDELNLRTVEFNSLLEAAIYLKSINSTLPDVFAIRSNISTALNSKTRLAYGYRWKEINIKE